MHPALLRGFALAATLLVLGACDAGDPPDGAAASAPGEASVELAPVNRSGITGTVRAEHDDEEATVTVELAGLQPGTAYPVHIHAGRCAAGGAVAAPLGRVSARQDGAGRLTTRVAGTHLGPDQPAFVQVHGPDGAAVACADIPGHDRAAQPLTERIDTAGAERPDTLTPAPSGTAAPASGAGPGGDA